MYHRCKQPNRVGGGGGSLLVPRTSGLGLCLHGTKSLKIPEQPTTKDQQTTRTIFRASLIKFYSNLRLEFYLAIDSIQIL